MSDAPKLYDMIRVILNGQTMQPTRFEITRNNLTGRVPISYRLSCVITDTTTDVEEERSTSSPAQFKEIVVCWEA